MEMWERPDGVVMTVHDRSSCDPLLACMIHNPSNHHMQSWPWFWRSDRGIMERICSHGIGHPDPDQLDFWYITGREYEGVHGCDGCCATPR